MIILPFLLGGPTGHLATSLISIRGEREEYSLYHQSNTRNVEVARSKLSAIAYKKEWKNSLIARKIVILESPYHLAAATCSNLSGKSAILISPKLIQSDEQAAGFILKHELAHIVYKDAITGQLVPLICSLAAGVFTLAIMHPLPATGITYLIGAGSAIAYSRFCEGRADDFAMQYSTAEELEGGKRFFQSQGSLFFYQDLDHPSLPSRIEKIDCLLHERATKTIKRTRKKHAESMVNLLRIAAAESAVNMEAMQNKTKWTHIQVLFFKCIVPSRSFPILLEKLHLCKKRVDQRMENPISLLPFCKVARKTGTFHQRYVFLKQIGSGSHSVVYLARDHQNTLLAIKKYKITDQNLLNAFSTKQCKDIGMTEESYIKNLAEIEKEIGSRTDHPNLMKIREVHLEGTIAYIVMEYVEGRVFGGSKDILAGKKQVYSLETRIAFMQQFLSAIEHLLSKNILADDLHSNNTIVSPEGTDLTLIDFGGYEIVDKNAELSVEEYLNEIKGFILSIDREKGKALLESCEHLIPSELKEETILLDHIPLLINWVKALQQKSST